MKTLFIARTLARKQQGATAIEYALIAGLIAAVLVGALTVLGGGIDASFSDIVDVLTGA